MKTLKYLFALAGAFICAQTAMAQDVSGVVLGGDGKPMPGAAVYWAETSVGTSANVEGEFKLHRVKGYDRLVASFIGYENDTLKVAATQSRVEFRMSEGVELESVVVEGSLGGNYVKQDGVYKSEMISFAGLCKMACCNLAESFENSASVTVGYSDAISGARQIKMLGLAGTYTQILDENRPIMRGLSSPYGLSYTPGMWLNSIQVSKGISSVTAGHEAMTGQINLEHRKPTDEERLFLNIYFDDELKPEINLSSAIPVTKDKRISTVILAHGSMDTQSHDRNKDGMRDMPLSNQVNIANRWLYQTEQGVQVRWGAKYTRDQRLGGDIRYKRSMRDSLWSKKIYGSSILNQNANAYLKVGTPVGPSVYDAANEEELRSSLAFVADYNFYDENAYFGLNDYLAREHSLLANLMYDHYFSPRHKLIVGAMATVDNYDESLLSPSLIGVDASSVTAPTKNLYTFDRLESEIGLYAEYTYTFKEKFSAVVGMRGDYNTFYRKGYFTPRGHLKWNITPTTILRASAGMGYRSTNVIADNIGILATGRTIIFDGNKDLSKPYHLANDFQRMESVATFGGSLSQTFTLVGYRDATLSFDYFRTEFLNRVIADQEWGADYVNIYATDGRSFTDNYQVDFTWTPIERFDIFATFRYTNAKQTIERADGTTALVESPLVSRFKTLLNLQYATKFRRWVFDVTAQYNGKCRLPSLDGDITKARYSPAYPMLFAQVSYKIKQWDIYVGCENILGYRQKDPILLGGEKMTAGANPYDTSFNSSVVWGPLKGRKFYIGVRFNLY
ncbi:MAG: TonB-dependent receptor [Alistipes sp.]|nr:TonB-dependent receptor [Alistipes sp.]